MTQRAMALSGYRPSITPDGARSAIVAGGVVGAMATARAARETRLLLTHFLARPCRRGRTSPRQPMGRAMATVWPGSAPEKAQERRQP